MKRRAAAVVSFSLVGAFLLIAGLNVPSIWEMSRAQGVALAILLSAATLWISEAVPLFVTSFFVLFLSIVWLVPVMQAEGSDVQAGAFLAPFFSEIILLFLGGFVLSAALHKLHLAEKLARAILARTGSSVPMLLLGIMTVTAFLSMWLSNTATAAMMLALVIPITERLPAAAPTRKSLLLSIPFAANIGGLGTPIGSPPNAIAMQYLQQVEAAPSFLTWVVIGVPGVAGMLVIGWLVLLAIYRGQASDVPTADAPLVVEWSPQVALVGVTSAVTVLGWMTEPLHGISAGIVGLVPVVVFFGTKLLSTVDFRSLSWDVLILMGGGLCLGTVIARSGLADWLVGRLPVEGLGVYLLMVLFGTVACAMSSVMSNTATANLIMPIMIGLAVEPVTPLLIGVAFACSMAMPLPVSTPPNAMAFSTGEIHVRDMLTPGLLITVVGVVLAFTTGYWWWDLVGLL